MSLATRCTACGTVFRVVQDQLKVSEGWVRCGRCDEVFNALEGLFDLEREAPPEGSAIAIDPVLAADEAAPLPGLADELPLPSPLPAPSPVAHPPSPADLERQAQDERIDAALASHGIDDDLFASRPGEPDTQLAEHFDAPLDRSEFSDARLDPELLTDEAALLASSRRGDGRPAANEHTPPEFLRAAERQARWQRPGVRAALGLLLLALTLGLGAQVTHHFRDTVAARWPQTRTALLSWCDWTACTLDAPRRIEDISVESTTLARTQGSDGFRFAVNLRNRGSLPLALPAVDLNLTDASGQLVARRVLTPTDFGARQRSLVPGSDTTLQLMLSTGNTVVSGYTVEVFYP